MLVIERTVDLRVPVSFRLPAGLVRQIEIYAEENRLSKTTAFEHFLQLGIKSEFGKESEAEDPFKKLDEKLDKILALMLKEERASAEGKPVSSQNELERIKEVIQSVSRSFPAVKKAYLFGECVREPLFEESPIGIRLKIDRTMTFGPQDIARFTSQVEQLCGRGVQVVSSKKVKDKQLAEAIAGEKKLVYERGE